jgi:MtN3 and saliva related transmembrane protein
MFNFWHAFCNKICWCHSFGVWFKRLPLSRGSQIYFEMATNVKRFLLHLSNQYHLMDLISIIGIGASICTAIASIPQLVKIIKCKKADDISLVMLLVLIIGLGLWVFYGYLKKDIILMVANAIPFIMNILIVIFSFQYKSNKAG